MRIKKKDIENKKVKVIKAPDSIKGVWNGVFLAGSIEMGKAVDWQSEITDKCKEGEISVGGLTIFNPRRDDWDSSWEQDIKNKKFKEQVEWELGALEQAKKIVLYIDPKTISPITILELGTHIKSGKLCVCCPEGFYRKGNVDVICEFYGVPMVDDIDGLVEFILDETN